MKLIRFNKNSEISYGVLESETIRVLSVSPFSEEWDAKDPSYSGAQYQISEVEVLTPCEPTKYIGLGMNYRDLAEFVGAPIPDHPITFLKPLCAVVGPGDDIVLGRAASQATTGEGVVYEGELCVVIGKKGKYISKEDAFDYVLGYTCGNDVTFRNEHGKDMIHSKGADTYGPIGPCISTEVDPACAHIRSWVNGEKRQDGCSDQMIFDVPTLIEYLSSYMTLMPGDIIATGTPAGIGNFKVGDTIRIEIDGIGVLENKVVTDWDWQ